MKTIDSYHEICSSLDGKKYREKVSFGFDFISRHKQSCRKLVSSSISESGELKLNNYEIYSYDRKENGMVSNVCKNCGYSCIVNSYHFIEDLIR